MSRFRAQDWLAVSFAAAAPALLAQSPPCSPYGDACLYSPGPARPFTQTSRTFSYRDITGAERTVSFHVRIPAGGAADAALPVVIWSHGGTAEPPAETSLAMKNWSEVTAGAGYLTISVRHSLRDAAALTQTCTRLEVPAELCAQFDPLQFDRPNDLRKVTDELERLNGAGGPPEWRGRVNLEQIAVAGFAEGSSAALSLGGARRMFVPEKRDLAKAFFIDERPVAFVALSPSSPSREFFFDTDRFDDSSAYDAIGRPVLLATSAAGSTPLSPPTSRRIPFELLPDGARYEIYADSVSLYHDFLGDPDVAACEAKGVDATLCANFRAWLMASVLAFLDTRVGNLPAARNWLERKLIEPASGDAFTLRTEVPVTRTEPAPCPGFAGCLYRAERAWPVGTLPFRDVVYTDITGYPRRTEITVRYPEGKPGLWPVLIVAHGGGDGRNDVGGSRGAMEQWGEWGAQHGYLTIALAFRARTNEERDRLCAHLKMDGDECGAFEGPSWDRPFDMQAVLNELERLQREGTIRVDLQRIGVLGHSAGSSGVLSIGGMGRVFNGQRFVGPGYFIDPRPRAVVALSPTSSGFSYTFDTSFNDRSTSWSTVDRPVLFASGKGDAHEQAPHGRRIGFGHAPPGDKFLLWVDDVNFGHENYGDQWLECQGVPKEKCEAFQALLSSTVLAFLDNYVLEDPRAKEYMDKNYVRQAGRNVAFWDRK
ncbi:MAG: hypothetical protein IT162_09670 [Bryobacterales bacterium]|nr:hypothetical protein [Bryobacterales bacterium]